MRKVLITICSLIIVLQGFTITQGSAVATPQGIPWPFQVLELTAWDVESVSLSQMPLHKVAFNTTIQGSTKQDIQFTGVAFSLFFQGAIIHNEGMPFTKRYKAGDKISFQSPNHFISSYALAGRYDCLFTFQSGNVIGNSVVFFYIL